MTKLICTIGFIASVFHPLRLLYLLTEVDVVPTLLMANVVIWITAQDMFTATRIKGDSLLF